MNDTAPRWEGGNMEFGRQRGAQSARDKGGRAISQGGKAFARPRRVLCKPFPHCCRMPPSPPQLTCTPHLHAVAHAAPAAAAWQVRTAAPWGALGQPCCYCRCCCCSLPCQHPASFAAASPAAAHCPSQPPAAAWVRGAWRHPLGRPHLGGHASLHLCAPAHAPEPAPLSSCFTSRATCPCPRQQPRAPLPPHPPLPHLEVRVRVAARHDGEHAGRMLHDRRAARPEQPHQHVPHAVRLQRRVRGHGLRGSAGGACPPSVPCAWARTAGERRGGMEQEEGRRWETPSSLLGG